MRGQRRIPGIANHILLIALLFATEPAAKISANSDFSNAFDLLGEPAQTVTGGDGFSPAVAVAPEITTQPASESVTAGQNATFSVAASGLPPLRYQWMKNGSMISGASSPSYTTPATTIADNGTQFTVVISNLLGSATSNPATLAVSAPTLLLGASPTSLSFGNVNAGSSSMLPVTLTNSGNSNVTISGVSVSGSGFTASGVSAGVSVAPGQSATLNVAFDPAAAGGVSGSVSVASNATNSPATIALSGTGVTPTPPTVAISSPTNGATVSGTITIMGTASDSAGLTSIQVQVDGGALSTASGTTNWSFSLNTGALSNAAHTITARATDTSGVASTNSVNVEVSNSSNATIVNVTDYGATGNGSSDDTAAIQNAIGALTGGATLLFPCGSYLVTSQLTISIPNITIDGSGCAIIQNTSSGTGFVIGPSNGTPNYGPAIGLSATANELDTSFTTGSSLGVNPGDYVRLQQGGEDSSQGSGETGCDPVGCRGELLRVASTSGNTITVTTALHDTYNPSVNAATAQKLLGPITGITLQNITFDGSGSNVYGLLMAGVTESTVSGVTSRNVRGAAVITYGNFNVGWMNITVTGAGSAQCGSAVWFQDQGNLSVNGMSLSSLNPGTGSGCLSNGAFGFEIIGSANSTITGLTVDATGAAGRPFKMGAARWNTFNAPTVKNVGTNYNGISIEYWSSHNIFNNCVVSDDGGGGTGTGNAGINSFGNFNQFNTFNNCTVSGNSNVQFLVNNFDALRLGADSNVTINGGTYTGTNTSEPVLLIAGANAYIHDAVVNGPGSQGLLLQNPAANGCINNNSFSAETGLGAAIDSNSSTNMGSGNMVNGLSSNLTQGTCTAP